MIETQDTVTVDEAQAQHWSQHLQRRIMRLLLQHDEPLFRNQFRRFFVKSDLPQILLLQQYDRYLRLHSLSNELLDAIMPRIRRQLSLKISHARLQEEAPTRGDIDWQRSIERSWSLTPGQPPLQFETRLRQQSMETPENLLVVAILLLYRQELHRFAGAEGFEDEELSAQERHVFTSAAERAERELAAPYARALQEQARKADIHALARHVSRHLRPGPNPYRDLLAWWERFTQFRVGRASHERALTLASKHTDEKTDAWLYEIWIALEWLHLLAGEGAVQPQDMQVATDVLQYTFRWGQRRFRFLYNRQLDTSTSFEPDWEHGPRTRPDYTIERETPLEIRHNSDLIWREPPCVLDAKYYLEGSDPSHTHGPIKKLLGDMTLLDAHTGALFFPRLPEAPGEQEITRTVKRTGRQYAPAGEGSQQIHLYHLEPAMSLPDLHKRLRAILDLATRELPERPQPVCQGIWLDPDTINASHHPTPARSILCPKPHMGPGVFDVVNVDSDCLKNPRLCHVIGQAITAPFVIRVTTQEQLTRQSGDLRSRSNEQLQQAEHVGDEARAELIRGHIFTGIGKAVEQYVKLFGNPKAIEENFERWAFGQYWQRHPRSLAETTRNALISGEQVWQNYQETTLEDWAAPAIQYCRALEFELKRRLYAPKAHEFVLSKAGFTLGTITTAYSVPGGKNWQLFMQCVNDSGSSMAEFEHIVQRLVNEQIREKRNQLAHGDVITREVATTLREFVSGDRNWPGVLCWLAEGMEPA
ncbi:MAG: hypothetical protein ABI456_10540 [Ktedonobacteraceae bacterium]